MWPKMHVPAATERTMLISDNCGGKLARMRGEGSDECLSLRRAQICELLLNEDVASRSHFEHVGGFGKNVAHHFSASLLLYTYIISL